LIFKVLMLRAADKGDVRGEGHGPKIRRPKDSRISRPPAATLSARWTARKEAGMKTAQSGDRVMTQNAATRLALFIGIGRITVPASR
jgi:hypothetical protein